MSDWTKERQSTSPLLQLLQTLQELLEMKLQHELKKAEQFQKWAKGMKNGS